MSYLRYSAARTCSMTRARPSSGTSASIGTQVPVACGEVNSGNGFGGYTGFEHFISADDPSLTYTYLERQVSDFAKLWNELCVR